MASCPHNVDEWVHCPAATLPAPSAIQVGNWVLIECNLREGKQHKQMNTQNIGHLFDIQQIQPLSANNCQCPSWGFVFSTAKSDMTSLVYAAIIHSPSLFLSFSLSLFSAIILTPLSSTFLLYISNITLLSFFVFSWLKCPCFNSSSSILPLLPDLSLSCSNSCSHSSASFFHPLLSFLYAGHHGCGWSSTTVQERAKKRKRTQWIVIYRQRKRKKKASFHLSLLVSLSFPSRITHNICTPTELLWDKRPER